MLINLNFIAMIVGYITIFFVFVLTLLIIVLFLKDKYQDWKWEKERGKRKKEQEEKKSNASQQNSQLAVNQKENPKEISSEVANISEGGKTD